MELDLIGSVRKNSTEEIQFANIRFDTAEKEPRQVRCTNRARDPRFQIMLALGLLRAWGRESDGSWHSFLRHPGRGWGLGVGFGRLPTVWKVGSRLYRRGSLRVDVLILV